MGLIGIVEVDNPEKVNLKELKNIYTLKNSSIK